MGNHKLAIAIPVYNNTLLFRQCLHSLYLQTNKNFDLYIFDDGSSEDYPKEIGRFESLSIYYRINVNNLGALNNMQYAFEVLKNDYQFLMIMHEDDLLHHKYVDLFLKAIVTNIDISFCLCNFMAFENPLDFNELNRTSYNDEFKLLNKEELALLYLTGKPLAFGSVIYNTKVFTKMNLDVVQYEEFADRPFLLNAINESNKVLLFSDPLYFYRSHSKEDNRWKKLNQKNIFNLLDFYKSILLNNKFISKNEFKKYAIGFIIESYKNLLLTGKKFSFFLYLVAAKRKGFFSLKYALLKVSLINKLATKIKYSFI